VSHQLFLEKLAELNDQMFEMHGTCVGHLRILSHLGHIDVQLLSSCGIAYLEVPHNLLSMQDAESRLMELIVASDIFKLWLCDVSFPRFSKAQLYSAIQSRIILPALSQVAPLVRWSVNRADKELKAVELDVAQVRILRIQHDWDSGGRVFIPEIYGDVPSSDEFTLRGFSADDLLRMELDDALGQIANDLAVVCDDLPVRLESEDEAYWLPSAESQQQTLRRHHYLYGC